MYRIYNTLGHDFETMTSLFIMSFNTSGSDDIFEVKVKLIDTDSKWREIGLALGLKQSQLKTISSDNSHSPDCLTEMLDLWLKQSYNVSKHGRPSWQTLSKAVRHRAGGNDPALADEIDKIWDFEHIAHSSHNDII